MLKVFFDRPDLLIEELVTEAVAIAVLLTIFLLRQRHVSRWIRAAERGLGRIARRRGLSITLIGLLALGASATLSLVGRMPQPLYHDEFSYLLAADTFAHGRLSNPPHPLWVHFENMHIIQAPTYASKYPPAQGLMLALGQVIVGHPMVGVWMSTGLACAAVYWMLLAWLPPWWAILGSLLAALHPGILLLWGQSYWGGNVAVMGGALVFGGVRRIVRRPRGRDAALLGVGLAVLANSRPYEGLLATFPVAVVLLVWMLGKNGPAVQVSIKRIVLPIFMILAVTGVAIGFYNLCVTGDPLRMPYLVHEATYSMAPIFLWQDARPEPTYRHESLRFHQVRALTYYTEQRSVWGLTTGAVEKAKELWKFYQGAHGLRLVLTVPLLLLPWVLRERWPRFALLTCGVLLAGMALSTWVKPHYAAPITALVCALMLQGMRHLRVWRWHGRPMGRLMVWTICLVAAGSFIVAFAQRLRDKSPGQESERARIMGQLTQDGRRHLVLVPQGPLHRVYWKRPQEWLYNQADIDGANILWAREMELAQNRKLLEYFKDREVWLLEVDQDHSPAKLVPYRIESRP
jgi:hypothetical protein